MDLLGIKGVIEEARRVVGDAPAYLSFDVDGIVTRLTLPELAHLRLEV